ncbi:MAG: acyl carrier protein [Bacilli bacterium]|nr:acyl carrier protein [Bacilli bacterium]
MFEKVQEIIAREMDIDKNIITMDSRLTEDLGADSLDAVELIMALEDEFNLSIDDDSAMKIKKVSDIVEYLEKLEK